MINDIFKNDKDNQIAFTDDKRLENFHKRSLILMKNFLNDSIENKKIKMPFNLIKQKTHISKFIYNIKGNYINHDAILKENLPFIKEVNRTELALKSFSLKSSSPNKAIKNNEEETSKIFDKSNNSELNESKSAIYNQIDKTPEKIIKIGDSQIMTINLNENKLDCKGQNNSYSNEKDDEFINARYNNFPSRLMSFNFEKKNYLKSDAKSISDPRNQNCILAQTELLKYNNNRVLYKFNNVYDSVSEEENELEFSSFHLNRKGDFKRIWDLIIFFMCLYSVIIYPYLISFNVIVYMECEIFIECIFIIDFVFNFFTSFHDEEENNITNLRKIIKNYSQSWFLLDFTTCIPFSLLNSLYQQSNQLSYNQINNSLKILKCLQWISLLRVLRIVKRDTTDFIKKLDIFEDSKKNRLVKFSLYFFIIIHVTSCLWVFIGKIQLNSDMNWIYGNEFENYINFELYIASFYFNLVTVYSIGYGDILAFSILERAYISIFMFISVILFSYAISNISTFLTYIDPNILDQENKIKLFKKIDKEYDIPLSLFNKIRSYLRSSFKNNYDERFCLLEFLPNKLKNELTILIYKNNIKKLCFFESQSNDFILFVLPMLITYNLKRGESLFSIGEYVGEMYLVVRGSLSLIISEHLEFIEICQIRKNKNFGELFLETNQQSPYELKCKSKTSEILVLKNIDYLKIKSNFSSNITRILEKSFEFLEIVERKRKIIKEFLKFDPNPLNLKNFMKILNIELMKNEFDDFYNNKDEDNKELNQLKLKTKENSENQNLIIDVKDNIKEDKTILEDNDEVKLSKGIYNKDEENKDNYLASSVRSLICDSKSKIISPDANLNNLNNSKSINLLIAKSTLKKEIKILKLLEENITKKTKSLNFNFNNTIQNNLKITNIDPIQDRNHLSLNETNKFHKMLKDKVEEINCKKLRSNEENHNKKIKKTERQKGIIKRKNSLIKRINIDDVKYQSNIIMKAKKLLKNDEVKINDNNEIKRKTIAENSLIKKNFFEDKNHDKQFKTSSFNMIHIKNYLNNESQQNSSSEKNKQNLIQNEIYLTSSFNIIQDFKKVEYCNCINRKQINLSSESTTDIHIIEKKVIDFQIIKYKYSSNTIENSLDENSPLFEMNSNEIKRFDKKYCLIEKKNLIDWFKKLNFINHINTPFSKENYCHQNEFILKKESKIKEKLNHQISFSRNMNSINKHLDILLSKLEMIKIIKN